MNSLFIQQDLPVQHQEAVDALSHYINGQDIKVQINTDTVSLFL